MKNLRSLVVVGGMCALLALVGCKKKPADTPAAGSAVVMAGSGSAAMAAGSADMAGSAAMGSATDTGSAGSAAMAGSGSAAGSDTDTAAGSGSAADAEDVAPPSDSEGKRNWNCKKTCKLAVSCKASVDYHDAKECENDCSLLSKDKDGRFARGSIAGAAYYTCIAKAKDCAGIKKCDHDVEHAK
jgi:hypothetical protein